MKGFIGNIEKLSLANQNFRQVLYTGQHTQLVVMSLAPKKDIGMEVHPIVDQFVRIEEGKGKVTIDGIEHKIKAGDAMIIPAETKHNITNTSDAEDLKLYTLYSPPHHKDKTIHKTKTDALKDKSDHI